MTVPPAPGAPLPRPEPLRESVYLRVVDLITSGHYRPGAVLGEAGLSRALGVSRTPVREALLRLQAEGVVDSALARGFTVRPLRPAEARELYPILAGLEALALRSLAADFPAAAGGARQPTAEALAQLDYTAAALARCEEPVQRWQLDSRWHTALVAASGNDRLARLTTQLRTSLSRYELAFMRQVTDREAADAQHHAILDALRRGEAVRAAGIVERHWHEGMAQVLEALEDGPPAQ